VGPCWLPSAGQSAVIYDWINWSEPPASDSGRRYLRDLSVWAADGKARYSLPICMMTTNWFHTGDLIPTHLADGKITVGPSRFGPDGKAISPDGNDCIYRF
jgi:hypothetical protein